MNQINFTSKNYDKCKFTAAYPGFPRRGEPTPEEGVSIYYVTKFWPQMHGNDRN